MAARFSRLTLLLLAAIARPGGAQAPDSSLFTRVVTGETLRKAGVIRLAEVLRLVDDWDVSTQDEFVWNATPAGEIPSIAPRWLVLVDGQRQELDLLGTLSIARIPVPLEAIDHIELNRTASLAAGELATAGTIHIRTREMRSGFSAAGWATTGSEIGDPGPFAFTPLATPNVDRIGNDGSGRISYREPTWFVEGSLQLGKQNPTDPAVFDRLAAASLGEGRVRSTVTAPVGRVGLRLPGSAHTLAVRYSRTEDFLPLEPVSGELAVTERYAQVTLDGTFGTHGSRTLRYYAAWADNRAEERHDALPTPFDWKAVTLTAGVEATTHPTDVTATVGLRARHVGADAPQPIVRDRLTIGSLYGTLAFTSPSLGMPLVGAELATSSGEVGVAASVRQRWLIAPRASLELTASVEHPLSASDNSIWAWSERGYPLLAESGVIATPDGPLGRPTHVALDAGVRVTAAEWARFGLEAFFHHQDGIALMTRELQLDPTSRSFGGPAFLTVDRSGQVAGGVASTEARWTAVTTRLAYRYQQPFDGDDQFRAAHATVPRHVVRYSLEATPVRGLDLWSMLEYQSSTTWRDFEAVEAATGGSYQARVPSFVGLDVAIQKWFWKRRLRAHLGFRNVFGSTLRYHPAGATLGPRMYVQFEGQAP